MSNQTKDYIECTKINLETAKLAKEKGFPQDERFIESVYNEENDSFICLPAQSIIYKWLREEHQIYINVADLGLNTWSTLITKLFDGGTKSIGGKIGSKNFSTYEEALENGLQEALISI